MSPANVYRFFSSRRAIEEAVVAGLLDEVFTAAVRAAQGSGSALERLCATFRAIAHLHERRVENDARLHELVAAAASDNWPIVLAYADRIRGLVRSIIVLGQADGEFRRESPMLLACCLLDAMDVYVSPSRAEARTVRPTFDVMMNFCAGALRTAAPVQMVGGRSELRLRAVGQS